MAWLVCCLLPLGLSFRGSAPQVEQSQADAPDALAWNAYRHVVRRSSGSVAFSPAALEQTLHLLMAGASGSTADELKRLPFGKQGVQTALRPRCAAALFVNPGARLRAGVPADAVFQAPLQDDAPRAADMINTWCAQQTDGEIASIVSAPDLAGEPKLVVAGAVALDEKWQTPFTKDHTRQAPFYLPDGEKKMVEMMHVNVWCAYAQGNDWEAVALPYASQGAGERGYFIAILPKGDAREFSAKLTPQRAGEICRRLRADARLMTSVRLPAFRLHAKRVDMQPVLSALGVRRMFTDAATFDGLMDGSMPLMVSKMLQSCFVEVQEQGTHAVAATVSVMPLSCAATLPPQPLRSIEFNRPFIWFIGDLSSAAPPWFMGLYEGE